MKTWQVLRAFDFLNIAVRTMSEKFTHRVLQSAFGCMDLGTEADAAKLSKNQRRIRNYMLLTTVVKDMQGRLVTIVKFGCNRLVLF